MPRILFAAALVVGAALLGSPARLRAAPGAPTFERDIRPLLAARCLKCHGEQQQGGLDLRQVAAILKGTPRGPVLAPGSAAKSRLYRRIAAGTMPPAGEPGLAPAQVALVRDWINAGAPGGGPGTTGTAARHWSFSPPARPAVPRVKTAGWVRTPVDAFVLARLEKAGIRPAPPADRSTLLRRVTLDLTGLPPTPDEQAAFLADSSPGAYEKVVDRLLASPRYGERWGRFWLDAVRYAESNGYERDGAKPNAWRYRDWVIDSLNADKPYDRFLSEQIAGDELPGSNAETQIAATFLRLGTWDDEPAEPALDRYDQLDDVLGTTATVFLGLTLRCARCHDHKFEPFTQRDYYRMLAVFEPLKRPQEGRTDLDRLVGTAAELAAYHAAAAKADAEIAARAPAVEALRAPVRARLFAEKKTALPLDAVAAFQVEPGKRTEAQKQLAAKHEAALNQEIRAAAGPADRSRIEALEAEIAAVNAARPPEPPRAYIWYEETPNPPATRILLRGDPARKGAEAAPGLPAVLARGNSAPPAPVERSSGRRLWLARWLASPANPLTARVIVNRIWSGHFGEGLVPTESDFGLMGVKPSDAALLDWLAANFAVGALQPSSAGPSPSPPAAPGSLKALHRILVLSAAYRMSSAWNPRSASRDPENRLIWRWRPRRLEAEAVRDSMLAVGGQLNLEMHGPGVFPTLPRAVLEGQSRPGDGWGNSGEPQQARRSIYIFAKRSLAVPELEVLDAPDTTSSCEQRLVSTIAPQALTFLNGQFANARAAQLAARLRRDAGEEPAALVRRAFGLTLCRPPTGAELRSCLDFLAAPGNTLESFCVVMLNNNEFVYLN